MSLIEQYRISDLLLLVISWIAVYLAISFNTSGRIRLNIRKLAGLDAIHEAIGSAAERGKNALISPKGSFMKGEQSASTVAYLFLLQLIAKKCSDLNVPLLLAYSEEEGDATPMIESTYREAILEGAHPEIYTPANMNYFTQYSYTIGTMSMIQNRNVGATFFFGRFGHEAVIYGESGQIAGAFQVAGTIRIREMPFFVATCDYTLLGEEYIAAGAYVSKDVKQVGAIGGGDWIKLISIALMIIGAITVTLGFDGFVNILGI